MSLSWYNMHIGLNSAGLYDDMYIYIYIYIGSLCKYHQRRLLKLIYIVNPFDPLFKKKKITKKSNLSLNNKNLKWGGEISLWNKYFSQIHVGHKILMSYISLKYIPIHIHNFVHSRVIMNMKLSSHGFLIHININRRENKAQISLIIHHNEKKTNNIFLMCSKR